MAKFTRTTFCRVALFLLVVAQSHATIAEEPQTTETAATKKKKEDVQTIPGSDELPPLDLKQTVFGVFQAAKDKKFEARLVQQSERGGFLLLRNVTGEDLNVRFPDAFVGVNVIGSGAAQQFGGQGTAQSTGIAVTSGQSRLAARNDTPEVFLVAAGETIRLPVTSVCLEYGKPTPNAKLRYVIMPVEQYSRNSVFHKLLPLFTKTKISQRVAQAAAWHVANDLSWAELSSILNSRSSVPVPLFTSNDLRLAQALVEKATLEAAKKEDVGSANPTSTATPAPKKKRAEETR
jgi:hypothetical protein